MGENREKEQARPEKEGKGVADMQLVILEFLEATKVKDTCSFGVIAAGDEAHTGVKGGPVAMEQGQGWSLLLYTGSLLHIPYL